RNKGAKKGPVGPRDQFVAFFHVDEADPLEYQAGIPQALRLMNSAMMNNTSAVVDAAIRKAGNSAPEGVVEQLYLMTLSRRPTPDERQRRVEYIARQPAARTAYGDLVWALLNCSEF